MPGFLPGLRVGSISGQLPVNREGHVCTLNTCGSLL